MNYLQKVLGFITLAAIFALLAAPYALVIIYPSQSQYFVEISETAIPWIVFLFLMLAFNESIMGLFSSIGSAIERIRRFSTPGASADFAEQGSVELSSEMVQQITNEFQQESNFAWVYFIRYVHATIYGSQFTLLEELQTSGPQGLEVISKHYKSFLNKVPKDTVYPLQLWLEYLTTNSLVEIEPETNQYNVTRHGTVYLTTVKQLGVTQEYLSTLMNLTHYCNWRLKT